MPAFYDLQPGIKARVQEDPPASGRYRVDFQVSRFPRGRRPDGSGLNEARVLILVGDDGRLSVGAYTPREGEISGDSDTDWQALALEAVGNHLSSG